MKKFILFASLLLILTLITLVVDARQSSSPIAPPTLTAVSPPTLAEPSITISPDINLMIHDFPRAVYEVASQVEPQEISESSRIRLRKFEIAPYLTQFERTVDFFGAVGPLTYTTYAAGLGATWSHQMICQQELPLILPDLTTALQNYVRLYHKENLAQYVESDETVRDLLNVGPELMNALMPLPEQWQTLSDTDYQAYMRWITSCMGVNFPVFEVEIENLSDDELAITEVLYRTQAVAQVLGAEYGPLISVGAYVHEIDWIAGDQAASLVPTLRLPPHSTTDFLLGVTTTTPDWGLCWLMKIFFIIDAEHGGISTPEFQLIMSGLPVP